MSIKLLSRWFASAVLVCAGGVLRAQSCLPPQPFVHSFQNLGVAALQGAADAPCALSSSLNSAAGPNAAAFVHYRRPVPTTSVRYSFCMDSTAIAPFLTTATRQVQLFSASAANPGDAPHMLQVILYGQAAGTVLRMYAACASQASHLCSVNQLLTQNVNVLRFEINVGAGTAGSVRYWVNADFTDPPTGVDDNHGTGLDNAASGGVIAAELGLSSATPLFRTYNNGAAVVFDQIQTSDDVLFWQNFELDQQ